MEVANPESWPTWPTQHPLPLENLSTPYIPMKTIKFLTLLSMLITGLEFRTNAQVIFVGNYHDNNAVGTYTLSGQTINPQFIGFVWGNPVGLAFLGNNLLVSYGGGIIAEFSSSGGTVNNSFITGLSSNPFGMVTSGGSLFVSGNGSGTIGQYNLLGQAINSTLIGFGGAAGLAVSGNNLYVSSWNDGGSGSTISEFTTAGGIVNSSLITVLHNPLGLAISGNDLFVANSGNSTIGEYTLSGQTVDASLVTGLDDPQGLAILGNDLFVTEPGDQTVGEYDLSGNTINASLITGLDTPVGITVTPEPSALAFGALGAAMMLYRRMRR